MPATPPTKERPSATVCKVSRPQRLHHPPSTKKPHAMRVTHVITRLIVGGAQENTVASVLGLQQKPGLEVNLISGPSTGPEGSLEHAFAHTPQTLTTVPELVRPVHPVKDLLA